MAPVSPRCHRPAHDSLRGRTEDLVAVRPVARRADKGIRKSILSYTVGLLSAVIVIMALWGGHCWKKPGLNLMQASRVPVFPSRVARVAPTSATIISTSPVQSLSGRLRSPRDSILYESQCLRGGSVESKHAFSFGARALASEATASEPRSDVASMSPTLGEDGTIMSILKGLFQKSVSASYPGEDVSIEITKCNNAKFGDYQFNSAMQLFGKLKKSSESLKSPRDVARAIINDLPENSLIEQLSIAGPGFINIKLKPEWIQAQIQTITVKGVSVWAPRVDKRVVVDFSSPNVAKEMHVGHLRSTIIGDTISRTLEFCGADVKRLNHVGDWGTQFGMLIEHMRAEGAEAEDQDIKDLQQLYRSAKQRFDEDEEFKTVSREAVRLLQQGTPEYEACWQKICQASREQFQAVYNRLNVSLEERGESFYNPLLPAIAESLEKDGVAEMSEGALCIFVDGEEIPLMLRKSDGGFGYASTDMAALKQRLNDEKAEWIIYVTDVGQKTHFDLVFKAAKKAHWLQDNNVRLDHVGFGLVLGEDGKRFRTRSGDLVRLVDLLDEAKSRCAKTIKERRPEISEQELEHASSVMGYGAVKYSDLKNNRLSNYKFSYEQMLSLQGDTAVYLLYAYARISGILRKSDVNLGDLRKTVTIDLKAQEEVALGLKLSQFPDAISDTLESLMPNRLTDFIYELTEVFNQFYGACKVIDSEEEASRLLLVHATANVMRQTFELLGITPLERI